MPPYQAPPPQRPPLSASQSKWSEPEHRREPAPTHRPASRGRGNNTGVNGDGADTVPGSGVASDDEDDPDEVPSATSGPWNSMLSLVEAARLKADNHESKEDDVKPLKDARPSRPFNYDVGGPAKKRRRSELEDGDKGGVMYEKGTHKHAFRDPVELGMLSNERGKQLYDQYVCLLRLNNEVGSPGHETKLAGSCRTASFTSQFWIPLATPTKVSASVRHSSPRRPCSSVSKAKTALRNPSCSSNCKNTLKGLP